MTAVPLSATVSTADTVPVSGAERLASGGQRASHIARGRARGRLEATRGCSGHPISRGKARPPRCDQDVDLVAGLTAPCRQGPARGGGRAQRPRGEVGRRGKRFGPFVPGTSAAVSTTCWGRYARAFRSASPSPPVSTFRRNGRRIDPCFRVRADRHALGGLSDRRGPWDRHCGRKKLCLSAKAAERPNLGHGGPESVVCFHVQGRHRGRKCRYAEFSGGSSPRLMCSWGWAKLAGVCVRLWAERD